MNRNSSHPRRKDETSRREAAQGRRVFISIIAVLVVLAVIGIAALTLL